MKRRKKLTIGSVKQYIKANRKASREEELRLHSSQVSFRRHIEKSDVKYDRKAEKRAVKKEIDGIF